MEVLAQVEARRRPASEALKDWGDVQPLRRLGRPRRDRQPGLRRPASARIARLCDGDRHAAGAGPVRRRSRLGRGSRGAQRVVRRRPLCAGGDHRRRDGRLTAADPLAGAPDWVRADVPEWAAASIAAASGDGLDRRGQGDDRPAAARSARQHAALDVRAGAEIARAVRSAADALRPGGAPLCRRGRAIPARRTSSSTRGTRGAGSRCRTRAASSRRCWPARSRASRCSTSAPGQAARPSRWPRRWTTRARSSPTTATARRLAPIYERLKRNEVHNAQVRAPNPGALDDLVGQDGSGRHRCALHRLRHLAPAARHEVEADPRPARGPGRRAARLLDEAVRFLRPGGELVYITCSILPEENERADSAVPAGHAGHHRDRPVRTSGPAGSATEPGRDFPRLAVWLCRHTYRN